MKENELPTGWKLVKLEDIAKFFISGGTPSTKKPEYWDGDIAWTTSAPIAEDDLVLTKAQRYITDIGLQKSASNLIPRGNILVGTRVGVGKAVVNLIDVAISQDLTGVLLKNNSIDAEFLAYQFKSRKAQQFVDGRKRGTTIKGISRSDLKSLSVYVPPLPEQQAIANTLRTIQTARETRQREIALEQERKAALMQHLFTYGTRGEPTKQTEIGEMPESWQVVKLGDVAKVVYGKARPKTHGSIPVVGSNGTYAMAEKPLINFATIIIGRKGSAGKATYQAEPCWASDTTFYLNWKTEICALYVYNYMQINGLEADESVIPSLQRGVVEHHKIPLCTLTEQQAIATILQACDTRIAALEREVVLLDELFKALIEELMSGRISVV